VILATASASACTCIEPPPPLEAMSRAEAVFLGVVVDADGPYPVPVGANAYRESNRWFRLRVIASWKGAEEETLVVTTGAGGGDCGYNFRVGDVYLVYAHSRSRADTVSTSLCSRTRPVAYARDDSVALGPPRLDRTAGRAWASFGPPPRCPVHPSYAVQRGHTSIVFDLSPSMMQQFQAAQRVRFPYAGMQIDRATWDTSASRARGLNDAEVCELCRARAQEWLGAHGDRVYRDFVPDSSARVREPSSARYRALYPMKRFAFLFDNGKDLKYDSIEGTLRRHVSGQRDSTVHLALSDAELGPIYERMIQIRFFDIPSSHPTYFVPDSIGSVGEHAQMSVFARSDTTVHQLRWDGAYAIDLQRMAPDWARLYGLLDVIWSTLTARPEYAALYGKKN